MEQIAAEEITSFNTSMDLLCRRRDLVLVVPGALICLRSLYQRAALRGVLSQLRYVILREEDYVVGTMEEKLRDVVRAAGNLPGVRVIVIYLSCLDILVRLDFADIEACLSAETGCVVRCFFRGPLAKADAMSHETAEDILRSLPPEETCIEADISLPPPMSDIAGAADFLRAADTANVLVAPSGCRSPIARMDMTRERRDVYAALPAAEDYIFGMEETIRTQVEELAAGAAFQKLNLLGSPVPAFMGMQEEFILENLSSCGCKGKFFPTSGFQDAVTGIAAASLSLVWEAAADWGTTSSCVYVLGWSEMLVGACAQFAAAEDFFAKRGYRMHIAGRDVLSERPALAWCVSAAGLPAADWLHDTYDIPVLQTLPLGAQGKAAWERTAAKMLGRTYRANAAQETAGSKSYGRNSERILLIGDPIASRAIVCVLRAYGYCDIRCAAYAWTDETAELYRRAAGREEILCFQTREELEPLWNAADIVVADPAFCIVFGEKRLLPLPTGYLSGRDAVCADGGVLGAAFRRALAAFLGIQGGGDTSKKLK